MYKHHIKPYTVLSVINAVILIIAAGAGVFVESTYVDFVEPLHLAESQGQDVTTLFIGIPLLLLGMVLAQRGSLRGILIWAGAAGYLLYANLIYAYGGVYNELFFLYVAACGLSLFTLIGLLGKLDVAEISAHVGPRLPIRRTAAYFLVTALLLILMWGAMAADSIAKTQIADANVIIVTDFISVIPAFVLAAGWLLQRKAWGYALSSIMFVQAITLGISIVAGQIMGLLKGLELSWGLAGFFLVFTLVGLAIGIPFFAHIHDRNEA
jgi:hypothetical protein